MKYFFRTLRLVILIGSFLPITCQTTRSQSLWTNITQTDIGASLCYANSIFVSVGNNGVIVTSTDGISWTRRASGVTTDLLRVKYGNGLFVAVGEAGTILTSANGISWDIRNSTTTKDIYGIFYANSTFVVVGDHMILTSANGTGWTQNTSFPDEILVDVTYGNGKFVAVCFSGAVLTSANGTSWTVQTSNTTNFLYSVTYDNNIFLAVGNAGTIITSGNGTDWVLRTSNSTSVLSGLVYANGNFVVTASNGSVLTSGDGTSWTVNSTPVTLQISDVTFGDSKFVALSMNGISLTSTNGTSWTQHQTGFAVSGALITDIIYNGQFTAVGSQGMLESSNGNEWTLQSGYNNQFVGGIAANSTGRIYGVTSAGNVLESPLSSSWGSPLNISGQALYDIAYGNGTFTAVANFGQTYASANGTSWTAGNLPGGSQAALTRLEYLNGNFVSIGTYTSTSVIYTSAAGITWAQKATVNSYLRDIAFGNGTYVIVGDGGSIYTSTDLVTWVSSTSGTTQTLRAVCFGYGTFAAVGVGGVVLTSSDGVTWTAQESNTTNDLYRIIAADGAFVAVGNSVILRAPADNPLPVKLVSFNAVKEDQSALLTWQTTEEMNSERFDIERSKNGKSWVKAGEVKAAGDFTGLSAYSFKDTDPFKGENLYRLKSIDRDGSYSISKIRSLWFESGDHVFLYPNPADDVLHMSGKGTDKLMRAEAIGTSGAVLRRFILKPGTEISIKGLPVGLYTIRLVGEDGTQVMQKVMVK